MATTQATVERIVREPVLVVREGKQVSPEIGKPFSFSSQEVQEISKLNETALEHIIAPDDDSEVAAKAKK